MLTPKKGHKGLLLSQTYNVNALGVFWAYGFVINLKVC